MLWYGMALGSHVMYGMAWHRCTLGSPIMLQRQQIQRVSSGTRPWTRNQGNGREINLHFGGILQAGHES